METDSSRSLYTAGFVLTGFNTGGKPRSHRLGGERLCWATDQILATNQALSCSRTLACLGRILLSAEACAKYASAYLQ